MKITPEQYQAALKVVKDYRDQVIMEVREAGVKNAPHKHSTLQKLLSTNQCSVRLHNVIYHNLETLGISTLPSTEVKVKVGDLEGVSALKLLSCPNAGVATVKEFKELCAICGVRWSP